MSTDVLFRMGAPGTCFDPTWGSSTFGVGKALPIGAGEGPALGLGDGAGATDGAGGGIGRVGWFLVGEGEGTA